MSVRQLVFLGVIGMLSLAAAIVTGPMVTDALLGAPDEDVGSHPSSGAESLHPEAAP